MVKIVIMAGPHAVGKTSILEGFVNSHKIVNMGNLMNEEGIKRSYITNRDSIRSLPMELFLELRDHAYARLSKINKDMIVDTHEFVLWPSLKRYMTGMPLNSIKRLKYISALIYIDAKPEEIITRIKKDKNRKRSDLLDIELIREERELNIAAMAFLSTYLNVPLYFINNRHGDLKGSKEKMRGILKEIFGR